MSKKKLSKREKEAKKKGVSVKDLKSSSKKKSSSKDDDKFKKAMKERGAWDYYLNLSPDQQEFAKYNWGIPALTPRNPSNFIRRLWMNPLPRLTRTGRVTFWSPKMKWKEVSILPKKQLKQKLREITA